MLIQLMDILNKIIIKKIIVLTNNSNLELKNSNKSLVFC